MVNENGLKVVGLVSRLQPETHRKLWLRTLLLLCLLCLSSNARGAEVVVPFPGGFIGVIGNNAQDARSITGFSALGIKRAFFVQETQSGIFELKPTSGGNNISITLRLEFLNGKTVDLPGGLYWQKKEAGDTKVFGFLADPSVSFNLAQYGGSSYQITGGFDAGNSNFGMAIVGSGLSFPDGSDIKGDAATAGLLDNLNIYLAKVRSLAPVGPVTVKSQNTCSLSPVVTGTVTLIDTAPNLEVLSVSVNGRQFRSSEDGLIVGKGSWSLALPESLGLIAGRTYSVSAVITNSDGYVLADPTLDELIITEVCDSDGDGVTDTTENADGTNAADGCDYLEASRTTIPSALWNNADCDGDGDRNETDPEPRTPCISGSGSVPDATNPVWSTVDCDGDGVPNGKEILDGTDPADPCKFLASSRSLPTGINWAEADCDGDGVTNAREIADGTGVDDPCSWLVTSRTLSPSSGWLLSDCDGDGDSNGTDSGPSDPCLASSSAVPDPANLIWKSADCDGDGVPNGKEVTDGTDPKKPCSFSAASQSLPPSPGWKAGDCDGDGVTNDREISDGTSFDFLCSFLYTSQTLTPSPEWLGVDCDGDGTPNGTDNAPTDPCKASPGSVPDPQNATWRSADCDNDGVNNGKEITDGTDPLNPCSIASGSQPAQLPESWKILDCDGDGTPNGTDQNPLSPVAEDDRFSVNEGDRVSFNILGNDDFKAGAGLVIEKVGGDAEGEISFNPLLGTFTYRSGPTESGTVTILYRVCNGSAGAKVCAQATITVDIDVRRLIIPEAFTPNGNGKNDKWIIRGLASYPSNNLVIFNRWGSKVYEAAPYQNDWDGTGSGGVRLPSGSYFYTLELGDGERRTGYVYLGF